MNVYQSPSMNRCLHELAKPQAKVNRLNPHATQIHTAIDPEHSQAQPLASLAEPYI